MNREFLKISGFILALVAMLSSVVSCINSTGIEITEEVISNEATDALVLYTAAYNNLSEFLSDDVEELKQGYVPFHYDSKMLFVFSHFPKRPGDYSSKTAPKLERFYRDSKGELVVQPVLVLDTLDTAVSVETVNKVFTYLKDNYKIENFGMIFSSHATGYMPSGYFSNPSKYEKATTARASSTLYPGLIEYEDPYQEGKYPLTKSLGQETYMIDDKKYMKEMDIVEFAAALPLKFRYILFDACLMGGIEVAYELKDKTDIMGFSPTEVLADGLDYTSLASHLLEKTEPDILAVSEDYIEYYMNESGNYQSATWSVVDCTKLDPIASAASEIFAKYKDDFLNMKSDDVQKYFYSSNKHWHYDLLSIVQNSGASKEEKDDFEKLIEDSIIYKGSTPEFISVPIEVFSGYSMMLPSQAGNYLRNYYKNLAWNKKTGLVLE